MLAKDSAMFVKWKLSFVEKAISSLQRSSSEGVALWRNLFIRGEFVRGWLEWSLSSEIWTDVYKFHRNMFCCYSYFSLPFSFLTHLHPGAKNSLHRSLTNLCWTVAGGRASVRRLGDFLWLNVLVTVTFSWELAVVFKSLGLFVWNHVTIWKT